MLEWVLNTPLELRNTLDATSEKGIVFEINFRERKVTHISFLGDFFRIKYICLPCTWRCKTV